MAQKKRKKTRCTANGVPLAAKLARDRMLREAMHQAAHDATVHVESNIRTQLAFADVMQDRSACDGIACVYDETAIRAACEAIQVAAMAKKYIAMEEGQHEQALR